MTFLDNQLIIQKKQITVLLIFYYDCVPERNRTCSCAKRVSSLKDIKLTMNDITFSPRKICHKNIKVPTKCGEERFLFFDFMY